MVWLLSSAGWHITSKQSIAAILPRLETRLPAVSHPRDWMMATARIEGNVVINIALCRR